MRSFDEIVREQQEKQQQRSFDEIVKAEHRGRGPSQPRHGMTTADVVSGVQDFTREFHTGLAQEIPPYRPVLNMMRGGEPTDYSSPETATEAAGRFSGRAAPWSLGMSAGLMARAGKLIPKIPQAAVKFSRAAPFLPPKAKPHPGKGISGIVDNLAQGTQRFYAANPRTAIATEVSVPAAAGAGGHMAKEGPLKGIPGAETIGQTASALASMGILMAPMSMKHSAKRGLDWFAQHGMPGSKRGAIRQSAQQMKSDAGDVPAAIRSLDSAPEGMPPARAIGSERMLRREAAVRRDYPEVDQRMRQALDEVQQNQMKALVDRWGRPVPRSEWQRRMAQMAAPEGVTIQQGDADVMLREAYTAFNAAYAPVKNQPVATPDLPVRLKAAVDDPSIPTSTEIRTAVGADIKSRLADLNKRLAKEQRPMSSEDILDLRSYARNQARSYRQSADSPANEKMKLYDNFDKTLTDVLEENLSGAALETLKKTDARYRVHKIMQDAAFRGGGDLTQSEVERAIRRAASSQAAYLYNPEDSLRVASQAGRPVSEILGDPVAAKRMVAGMDGTDLAAVRADFMDTLARQAKPGPGEMPSGKRLKGLLAEHAEVAKALGFNTTDMAYASQIASVLEKAQATTSGATPNVSDSMSSAIHRLVAAWMGSKAGSWLASRGGPLQGHGLIMAGRGAGAYERSLSGAVANAGERLIVEAMQDPVLARSLLVRNTAPISQRREAAQVIGGYLAPILHDHGEETVEALRNILGLGGILPDHAESPAQEQSGYFQSLQMGSHPMPPDAMSAGPGLLVPEQQRPGLRGLLER